MIKQAFFACLVLKEQKMYLIKIKQTNFVLN